MNRFLMLIIISSFILIIGCSSATRTLPPDVNIKKNQLIYIDDTLEIWANDGNGKHHNYTPKDSVEYKVVTNHIGSNLNSVFLGYCNFHNNSEIVSVGPEIVSIVTTKKTFQHQMPQEKLYKKGWINGRDPSTVSIMPNSTDSGSSGGKTHSTIQSEQKTDTKN